MPRIQFSSFFLDVNGLPLLACSLQAEHIRISNTTTLKCHQWLMSRIYVETNDNNKKLKRCSLLVILQHLTIGSCSSYQQHLMITEMSIGNHRTFIDNISC